MRTAPVLAICRISKGSFPAARIPDLNASKITAGDMTRPLQPGDSGFTVQKITVADATPTLSDLVDGEIYFEY